MSLYYNDLPPEIWREIFSHIPSFDLFASISQVSSYWRNVVYLNERNLPRLKVHVRVFVMDFNDRIDQDGSSHDSSITFALSVYDPHANDYSSNARKSLRGNEKRLKMLYISYCGGRMICEIENNEGEYKRLDNDTVSILLSWMEVESMRIEVDKNGNELGLRRFDDRLVDSFEWCTRHCSKVNVKRLTLTSINATYEWKLGDESIKLLQSLPLQTLTIENMPSIDIFSNSNRLSIPSLFMTMQHSHRKRLTQVHFLEMNIDYLLSLLSYQSLIHHSIYSNIPSLLSAITANDLAIFIISWRGLSYPSLIHSLSFNSFVSLSDFRYVFPSKGLDNILEEIPYCRYRTLHPIHSNFALELACYGNGFSTQWSIKSGELSSL